MQFKPYFSTLLHFLPLLVLPANAQLNSIAKSAGKLYFGSATDNLELTDTAYVAVLSNSSEFGQITPGNSMKWVSKEPNCTFLSPLPSPSPSFKLWGRRREPYSFLVFCSSLWRPPVFLINYKSNWDQSKINVLGCNGTFSRSIFIYGRPTDCWPCSRKRSNSPR